MNFKKEKQTVINLLETAGITVKGESPYDICIRNDKFYDRIFHQPILGLGESYMDRWWECKALDRFIEKMLRANLLNKLKPDWATIMQ